VFTAYTALYNYLQDYYNNLVNLEPIEESNSNSNTDLKDKQGPLADFKVFLRQRL
jgi:hypothetical protein